MPLPSSPPPPLPPFQLSHRFRNRVVNNVRYVSLHLTYADNDEDPVYECRENGVPDDWIVYRVIEN
eukprot:4469736-Pleurochrysis_carterae.AAC.1